LPPVEPEQELPIGYVTAASLNVRNGPSIDYEAIGFLYQCDSVTVLDKHDEWWIEIDSSGDNSVSVVSFVGVGYVSSRYITYTKSECNRGSSEEGELPVPSVSPTETSEPTPTIEVAEGGEETGTVVRVVDGDTIDVSINGQTYRVRYIGMNTPETNEPCGSEATDYNAGLVSGQTVTLVKDTSETDRYDRLLRYVYVGDTFVNATLVEDGYAEAAKYPPDDEYADFFDSLQDQAESANIGCWPTGVFSGAGDGSEAEEAEEPADGSAVATCPNVETCIKGNINSEGEKIYHLPDCPSYSRTQIDESKGER
jgi:endonuclease YncB( thermonuclease family)